MNCKKIFGLTGALLFFSVMAFAGSNEKGIDYYRAGLYEAAKIFFTGQTNQSVREQAENYYYLGETYYALEDFGNASEYFDKAVTTDSSYPFGYVGQGKIQLKNGSPKGAEDLFKKANGLAKKDPSVQTGIAQVYIDFKMYDKAKDALEKARKINKKYPGIYVAEGNMFMQEGKAGEASARYQNAILFDPNSKLSYLEIARVYKAINPKVALENLDKLIAIDPDYIPAYALIGDINYAQGNYKSALDAYRKFISIPGVPLDQHESYAQILYFTGQYNEALEKIDYILKQEPNNHVMHRIQAYCNLALENYDKALQQMEQFMNSTTEDQRIYLDYLNLGRIYLEVNKPEEAVAAFKKAETKEGTKTLEVYKELIAAYEKLKDYPKAIEYYEKYMQIVPADDPNLILDYFNYGNAYYALAVQAMSKLIQKDPALAPAEEATTMTEFKNYVSKGQELFSKVVELRPESFLGYIWRANINSLVDVVELQKTNKMTGVAKPYYEEAIEIMVPRNAEGARNRDLIMAYDYLSGYYFSQGDNNQVIEYNKKIVELDPENQKARSTLEALKVKI